MALAYFPFTPAKMMAARGVGYCGAGPDVQANIHVNSRERIELFQIPKEKDPDFDEDLVRLAEYLNAIVDHELLPMVVKKRALLRDSSIEAAVHLSRGGLRLVYAKSAQRAGKKVTTLPKPGYPVSGLKVTAAQP